MIMNKRIVMGDSDKTSKDLDDNENNDEFEDIEKLNLLDDSDECE